VMNRLKLAAVVADDILQACKLWQGLPTMVNASLAPDRLENSTEQPIYIPSAVATRLDGLSPLALYTAFIATSDTRVKELLHTYVIRWQNLRATITGDDLRRRGVPPGPIYARILTALRDAWLDGVVTSASQEAELLEKLLREPLVVES
jgi:hypothetical protein